MVGVGLIALVFGGARWIMQMPKRATEYRRLAAEYEWAEDFYNNPSDGPPDPVAREKVLRYIALLKVKYDHAARRPWLPVGLDPPEPAEATKWGIKIHGDPDEDQVPVLDLYPNHPPRF